MPLPNRDVSTIAPLSLSVALLLAGCGGSSKGADMGRPSGSAGGGGRVGIHVGAVVNMNDGDSFASTPPPGDGRPHDEEKEPKGEATAAASALPNAPTPDPRHTTKNDQAKNTVQGAVVDSGGSLSEAEVRTALVQQQSSFRNCIELGLASGASSVSGTVILKAAIGPTGTVATVEVVASTTKNSRVDGCVADAVRRIQFPAKGASALVGFPIDFGH